MTARAIAILGICMFAAAGNGEERRERSEGEVGETIKRFERAVQARDLPGVAELVAKDIVVFENGHRNDGWQDFRDNHLVPEMREPASPQKSELVKVVVSSGMAWAYTRSDIFAGPPDSRDPTHLLWSIYVLQKRRGRWQITMLDWSIAKLKR